jgi:DNA-binding protein H-NS
MDTNPNGLSHLFEQATEYKSHLKELEGTIQDLSDDCLKAAVENIREGIETFGWNVEEVIEKITGSPKRVNATPAVVEAKPKAEAKPNARSRKANGAGKPVFILVSDPSKTYSGKGRKPDWMLEALEDAGIDPRDKDAYLAWRDNHMKLVGAVQAAA